MNESYVTVVGNVTAEPVLRETKNGRPFATFRVASTARRYDPGTRGYIDAGTNFVSVVTFNALAANVVASVHKGQPVVVHGRLRINSWATTEGRSMISVEVDAHTVGHDLTKGQSLFSKPVRAQFDPTDRMGAPEVQASLAALETPDFEDFEAERPALTAVMGAQQAQADEGAVRFDLATAVPETDEYLAKVG